MSSPLSFPYLDFFQMVHSISSYYRVSDENMKAFKCMFISSLNMITTDVYKSIIREAIEQYELDDIQLQSSENLLKWSYLVNAFVHTNLYGNPYQGFMDFQSKYRHENMVMSTWSHPTWKMIHYFASNYDSSQKYFTAYKAFISCLQFLLPCAKCREHLSENLANHPIDSYRENLFRWSFILHQHVSEQTGKKGIPYEDALQLYGLD